MSTRAGSQPAASGASSADVLWPDYGGACLTEIVPTLLERHARAARGELPEWFPKPVADAEQVVLLVLDGLGYEQWLERRALTPVLGALEVTELTSVAPSTTATALTSIVTGLRPAEHGLLGYRLLAGGEVLNVLRWTTAKGDARKRQPPATFQDQRAFRGADPPVISRAEFSQTGFTEAHLGGARLVGWRMASSLAIEVRNALQAGEPFVYAYYDGVDKIAHEHGLGEHYAAELAATDRLVGEILDVLPARAALLVTADHGQVEVVAEAIRLPSEITTHVDRFSGEGRFRWLHTSSPGEVAMRCEELYGKLALVATRDDLVSEGLFGGPLSEAFARRLGDVALIARAPIAFFDPSDTGELALVSRHGALTSAEMRVPLFSGAR